MPTKKTKSGMKASAQSPKRKAGRPLEHVPTDETREQAMLLAGLGLTRDEIALVMDITDSTLKRHYPKELKAGGIKADAKVLTNLYRMATSTGPESGKAAIFWAKVRRRWHEVQRVIHGYDPETINGFVKAVVQLLRRELPDACPHCKTKLALPAKIALQLQDLSNKLAEKLPPSEIVPMPRPELAGDGPDA